MNAISEPVAQDQRVTRAVEEYLAAWETGRRPNRQEFLTQHADIADALADCLDGLDFIRSAAPNLRQETGPYRQSDAIQPEGPLGDFRIVREVGRGGMGVVYEAEQISLGRRVALKVLPFASTLDSKQLQRFKNEAQAAAHLHHTNIVPVFATGCERGVHYYAMQFIEGQTLAAIIADLRIQPQREEKPTGARSTAPVEQPNGAAPPAVDSWATAVGVVGEPPLPPAQFQTQAIAGISTEPSTKDARFFQCVATLGIQAAEALQHAHELGVIHRDIKPANLMVQTELGESGLKFRLWVTDFGLAHCQNQVGLTITGDLMGTLRYMSPEQALAKRVPVDHRTDIYSLGVTLYELLTLEPAFAGTDRQELLRQIAFEEAWPPRRLNKAIPPELETIVGKAMEKNPADRYATAQELADDLDRFLKDEPIRARRPTLVQRARKWSRRHRHVVWSAVVCTSVAVLLLAACMGYFLRDRSARKTALDAQVNRTLDEAPALIRDGKWSEATTAMERAEKLLLAAGRPDVPPRLTQLRKDTTMARLLEEIYSHPKNEDLLSGQEQDSAYAKAFRDYGIDVDSLPIAEAAHRIQGQSIRLELVRALDFWSTMRWRAGIRTSPDWKGLLEIAEAADPDSWRGHLRKALRLGDRKAVERLAASAGLRKLAPGTLHLLGRALREVGAADEALNVLRRAQVQYPGDLWINHELGWYCLLARPPQLDDALRFYTAALAIRPDNPYLMQSIGMTLLDKKAYAEAVAVFSQVIERKPDYVDAWWGRAHAYIELGQVDMAMVGFAKVVELAGPRLAEIMKRSCLPPVPEPLDPKDGNWWQEIGWALYRAGHWQEALLAAEKALALSKGGDCADWFLLAMAHWQIGNHGEARRWYKQAIAWMDNHPPGSEELRRYRAEAAELLAGIKKVEP
jgi:serine/threonine protein kinase/Flp pilus assembly protein TadD